MTDDTPAPAGEGAPGDLPDPMALLAFVQRMMQTASEGGDMEALMAQAPPGFAAIFEEAQRRAAAGEVPDMSAMMGIFGGIDAEDPETTGEEDDVG